jgi:hypothetical protein
VVQQRKSLVLRKRYLKPPPPTLALATIRALDRHLAGVIDSRIRGVLYDGDPQQVLRYPPIEILHEVPRQRLWFPVPGMYGGFAITLADDFLEVKSWCRIAEGSGQSHLITSEGAILVDEGFDDRPEPHGDPQSTITTGPGPDRNSAIPSVVGLEQTDPPAGDSAFRRVAAQLLRRGQAGWLGYRKRFQDTCLW